MSEAVFSAYADVLSTCDKVNELLTYSLSSVSVSHSMLSAPNSTLGTEEDATSGGALFTNAELTKFNEESRD